ncbi:MAG: radical SAM protein [Candidatus Altiarchaeota archaeon]
MSLINKFDPWNSKLCTCPEKLSLNVYTGCSHSCLYCYSSSYIKNFFRPRVKKSYLKRLKSEVKKLNKNFTQPISISNSSDPYIQMEKKFKYTRETLKFLESHKKLIVTKSDIVKRDIDLLAEKSVVAITITTLDERISKKIEPNAPKPKNRLYALKKISDAGIPTVIRIDPIIPYLNDSCGILNELIEKAYNSGVLHVISSTYKVRADNFKRMCKAFPEFSEKWYELYFKEGGWIHGSYYLKENLRFEMMKKVKEISQKFGLTFSCCREGFPFLNSKTCDGSSLLK